MIGIRLDKEAINVTVLEVDKGIRVYKLGFDKENIIERAGFARIDFSKFEDEKLLFFNKNEDGTVSANIHNCSDLSKSGKDFFYAWEGRLGRIPTTCPRCKSRLDSKPKRA